MAERLRSGHDTCTHTWVRRDPAVSRSCANCGFSTYCYNYHCVGCDMAACHVCRFHRMGRRGRMY